MVRVCIIPSLGLVSLWVDGALDIGYLIPGSMPWQVVWMSEVVR